MPMVILPGPLVPDADGRARVDLGTVANTVAGTLEGLFRRHPRLRTRILDESGALRPNVNVFVDSRNVRHDAGLDTPVPEAAEVFVLPAISGG